MQERGGEARTGRATGSGGCLAGQISGRHGVMAGKVGDQTVIVPVRNKTELEEVPPKIKRTMTFVTVGNVREVLELALVSGKKGSEPKRKPAARRAKPKTTKLPPPPGR